MRTLRLYDYNLTDVHAEALHNATKFFDNFITRLLIDNCDVNDK
jgi:hypothetical protein